MAIEGNALSGQLTAELLDRPIAFHRSFITFTRSVTASLLLSQAVYWGRRTTDADGWFWKTRDQWTEETGLTRSEIESARRNLTQHGVLQEKLRGAPARLYYRVVFERLAELLVSNGAANIEDDDARTDVILQRFGLVISRMSFAHTRRVAAMGFPWVEVDLRDVLKRDKARCKICGEPINFGPGQLADTLQFHHTIRLIDGGKHDISNIVCVHAECHAAHHHGEQQTSLLGSIQTDSTSLLGSIPTERPGSAPSSLLGSIPTVSKGTETTSEIPAENTGVPLPEKPPKRKTRLDPDAVVAAAVADWPVLHVKDGDFTIPMPYAENEDMREAIAAWLKGRLINPKGKGLPTVFSLKRDNCRWWDRYPLSAVVHAVQRAASGEWVGLIEREAREWKPLPGTTSSIEQTGVLQSVQRMKDVMDNRQKMIREAHMKASNGVPMLASSGASSE